MSTSQESIDELEKKIKHLKSILVACHAARGDAVSHQLEHGDYISAERVRDLKRRIVDSLE